MKKQLLLLALFAIVGTLSISAQTSSLENTLILAEDSPHKVTQAKIIGIDDEASPTKLYYTFTHPGGGVQKVNGSLFSGGKEPANLTAFGQVTIPETGAPEVTIPVKWVAQRHGKTNVNYYANPLVNATALNQEPLARKGQVASYDTLRSIERSLTAASQLSPMSFDSEEKTPSYIPEYYQTVIYIGMSGGFSQVATLTHRLKSEEDRNKVISLGGAYKSDNSSNKDGVKGIFGADNISFKQTAGAIPTVCDPLTGNAMVMGGIKYKKDKTKANSEYSEFRLFTFNKEGNPINSVVYESDQPISIEGAYPIYGEQLAPDVMEITHSVIIARGGGSRKMTGINKKHYRALVVDLKTGELIAESETELPHELSGVLESRQLPNGGLELLYLTASNNRGLSLTTIGKDAQITQRQFDAESPEVESLKLPAGGGSLSTKTLFNFPLKDGSELVIKNLLKKESVVAGQPPVETTISLAAFKYDTEGSLQVINGISEINNVDGFNLLTITESHLVFYEQYTEGELSRSKIRFTKIDRQTLEVEVFTLPQEYFLIDRDSFFYDIENDQVLFLTQEKLGQGLNLSRFKY